jgi:hypothetical protein
MNASKASIDQGVGDVAPSGSKQVCPAMTTEYKITATGDGGSKTAAATITLTPLAVKVMTFGEAALFEFGKAELKPEARIGYRTGKTSCAARKVITGYRKRSDPARNDALSGARKPFATISSSWHDPRVSGRRCWRGNPIADNTTDDAARRIAESR